MPFREKAKKQSVRPSKSTKTQNSTTIQPIEKIKTPSPPISGNTSGTSSPLDREHLTIDPRELALTQIDSNATIKKKSTLSKFRSQFKKEDPFKDWPEHIYKPHEIPRMKYRRPIDPDHQQTLQSYSLRNAFSDIRRKSVLSQYSPMGSRVQSRRGSYSSRIGNSAAPSRNQSIAEVLDEDDVNATFVPDVSQSRVLMVDLDASTPSRNQSVADVQTESDVDEVNTPDLEHFLLLSDDEDFMSPISMRSRGNTLTMMDTVPDLVQSSSVHSDDTDSIENTSQLLTLGNISQSSGLDGFIFDFGKPFDGDEFSKLLTEKLVTAEEYM